jgi:tetratricopeptide (TPR) repeat protein
MTTKRDRFDPSSGLFLLTMAFAVLLVCAPAPAQEEGTVEQIFASGKHKYETLDFQGCIEELTKIIDQVSAKLEPGQELSEEEKLYFPKALEYRSLANFNLADDETAGKDFRMLIRFSPGYNLSKELASPLIDELFQGIKSELVGYISVASVPSGADLIIDGEKAGETDIEEVPVLAGSHSAAVSLKGFSPVEFEINIRANDRKRESFELQRNTATLYVITSPAGAEVLLDGQLVGTTSGTAGSDFAERAAELGIPLEQLSAKFQVPYVEMGQRVIVARKECYVSSALNTITINTPLDFASDPIVIVLQPSVGSLELVGVPQDARVLLNGQEQSKGQAVFNDICAQDYDIEVLHAAGTFRAKETIFRGQKKSLQVKLRPALVYIGEEFRGLLEDDQKEAARRTLRRLFSEVDEVSLIGPDEEIAVKALADEGLATTAFAGFAAQSFNAVPQELYSPVRRACRRLNAALLAVSVFQERRIGSRFRLLVFSAHCSYPDSIIVDIDDPARLEQVRNRLNYRFSFEKSWLGITFVDTRMQAGTAIIAVQAGSPAAEAGVEAGSFITAVDGQEIKECRQVMERLKEKQPGETLVLSLTKGRESSEVTVTLGKSPLLLPLYSQSFSYNAAISRMALAAAMEPDSDRGRIALLNIGLAQAHFGAWEEAIAYLRRLSLGEKPGINQGTVEFYMGLCYEKLGYNAEALTHYRNALGFEGATFESNDGPAVAPEARQKVKQLEGS